MRAASLVSPKTIAKYSVSFTISYCIAFVMVIGAAAIVFIPFIVPAIVLCILVGGMRALK